MRSTVGMVGTEPSATVVAEFCARNDAAKSGGAQLGHQAVACHSDRNAAFATFSLALFGTGNSAAGPAPPCVFKLALRCCDLHVVAHECLPLSGFPDTASPMSRVAAGIG